IAPEPDGADDPNAGDEDTRQHDAPLCSLALYIRATSVRRESSFAGIERYAARGGRRGPIPPCAGPVLALQPPRSPCVSRPRSSTPSAPCRTTPPEVS